MFGWVDNLLTFCYKGICDCFGFLIISLLTLFFALLLLIGAYKKCHNLVMSWLVAAGIVFSQSNLIWFKRFHFFLHILFANASTGSGSIAHLAITGIILTTPSTFELSALEEMLIIIIPTIVLCDYSLHYWIILEP